MSIQKATFRISLLVLIPVFLSGCYTQFQSTNRFPIEDDRYSDYYAWDGFEEGRDGYYSEEDYQTSKPYTSEEEIALENDGYYYKDYETERWYKENYANKLFWEGYDEGYMDGYEDGSYYYPESARYRLNKHRYLFGYTGAFEYYDFYHYPRYYSSIWYDFGGFPVYSFYGGTVCDYWTYPYIPGYNPYCWYRTGWGRHYYGGYGAYVGVVYAYNDYHRYPKRFRDAEIYRKGPRSNGVYRTRSGSSGDYRSRVARSSGVTRSRGSVTRSSGVRSRSSSGSSVGRTRSSGRSSGVGKSSSSGRSRGSGSVGRSRSGSSSSKGRSRGSGSSSGKKRGNNDQGISSTNDYGSSSSVTRRVYRSTSDTDTKRTYTIPARRTYRSMSITPRRSIDLSSRSRVNVPNRIDMFRSGSTSRSSIFNSRSSTNTVRVKNFGSSSSSRSGSSSSIRSSSSRSSGSGVSRSSSSRSSSKGRSSGSSSGKRKRGGN